MRTILPGGVAATSGQRQPVTPSFRDAWKLCARHECRMADPQLYADGPFPDVSRDRESLNPRPTPRADRTLRVDEPTAPGAARHRVRLEVTPTPLHLGISAT